MWTSRIFNTRLSLETDPLSRVSEHCLLYPGHEMRDSSVHAREAGLSAFLAKGNHADLEEVCRVGFAVPLRTNEMN